MRKPPIWASSILSAMQDMAYAALYLAAALVLAVKTDVNPFIKGIVCAGAVGLVFAAAWQAGYRFSRKLKKEPNVWELALFLIYFVTLILLFFVLFAGDAVTLQ
jgi:hypothetical protein